MQTYLYHILLSLSRCHVRFTNTRNKLQFLSVCFVNFCLLSCFFAARDNAVRVEDKERLCMPNRSICNAGKETGASSCRRRGRNVRPLSKRTARPASKKISPSNGVPVARNVAMECHSSDSTRDGMSGIGNVVVSSDVSPQSAKKKVLQQLRTGSVIENSTRAGDTDSQQTCGVTGGSENTSRVVSKEVDSIPANGDVSTVMGCQSAGCVGREGQRESGRAEMLVEMLSRLTANVIRQHRNDSATNSCTCSEDTCSRGLHGAENAVVAEPRLTLPADSQLSDVNERLQGGRIDLTSSFSCQETPSGGAHDVSDSRRLQSSVCAVDTATQSGQTSASGDQPESGVAAGRASYTAEGGDSLAKNRPPIDLPSGEYCHETPAGGAGEVMEIGEMRGTVCVAEDRTSAVSVHRQRARVTTTGRSRHGTGNRGDTLARASRLIEQLENYVAAKTRHLRRHSTGCATTVADHVQLSSGSKTASAAADPDRENAVVKRTSSVSQQIGQDHMATNRACSGANKIPFPYSQFVVRRPVAVGNINVSNMSQLDGSNSLNELHLVEPSNTSAGGNRAPQLAYNVQDRNELTGTGGEGNPAGCDSGPVSLSSENTTDTRRLDAQMAVSRGTHECTVCGSKSGHKSMLEKHLDVPTKPDKCSFCDMKVPDKQSHGRRHTADLSQCPLCGRKYVDIIGHMKLHSDTGIRHVCSVCKTEFTEVGSLSWHVLSHAAEKRYRCQHCGKPFRTGRHLRSHCMI